MFAWKAVFPALVVGCLAAQTSTISYVQGNYATPQEAQYSVSVTFAAAQAAGDLNVVAVGWNDTTAVVSSVTDTNGNTYTLAVGPTAGAGVSQSIYYANNITAAGAGANTVIVTFSVPASYPDIRILEYSGADPNSPVDVTAASTGTSTSNSSGPATTTNPTDLIFGAGMVSTYTTATGFGFTSRILTAPDGDSAEDAMVTAIGSYSATATTSPEGPWVMQMVAFRTPVGSTGLPGTPTNLTATAAGASQINLSWNASTSAIGVAYYNIQRCQGISCTDFSPIATPTGTTYSDTGLAASTAYSYQVQAVDTAGNASPFTAAASAATQGLQPQPPGTPTNLAATAAGTSQIDLGWNASTSSIGIAYYVVQRCPGTNCTNFSPIAAPTGTTYSDTGLNPSTSYSYEVQAVDSAGNTSPFTGPATAITAAIQAPPPPATPTNLAATAVGPSQINLSWTASTSNTGLANYNVQRCLGVQCTNFVRIASPGGTTYNDTGLVSNTTYSYQVQAVDTSGNVSSFSTAASATTPPQSTVTDTSATIGYVQGNYAAPQAAQSTVNVTFPAAQVAGDLNVIVVGWNDTTAVVNSVSDTSGNTYTLAVGPTVAMGLSQSIYFAGNIAAAGAGANTVTVTFSVDAAYPDIRILEYSGADPNSPVDVTAASAGTSTSNSSGSATTTNPTDLIFGAGMVSTYTTATGFGFTSRFVTAPNGDSAEDAMVTATGSYSATATTSPEGPWIMQMVAFRTPVGNTPPALPATPTNLTATAAGASQINLSWNASTSSTGIAYYNLQRCQGAPCSNFVQIATPAGTTYSDTGLAPSTTYSYEVQAVDTAGNVSPFTSAAGATTSGTQQAPQPPGTPTNLTATPGGAGQMILNWFASTSSIGIAYYNVQRCQGRSCNNFAQIATPAGTTYVDTGLADSTSYSYEVQAVDTAGNMSAFTSPVSARTQQGGGGGGAPLPPGTPTNLTAAANGAGQIILNWSPSTSTIGIAYYNIQRCQGTNCASFSPIATFTGTTYVDTGLADSTSYSYELQAVDTAGNVSSFSAPASATTQGSQQPGAPTNLTATAAGPSQINLSWTSTSNAIVANYNVERCQGVQCANFAQVASPSGTTYNDTGLAPGTTYSYQVQAVDASGNASPFSPAVAATTLPAATTGQIPTMVQHYSSGSPQGADAGNNFQVPFPNPTGSGNLGLVCLTWTAGQTVSSVQDDQGNTWIAGPFSNKGSLSRAIYYLPNLTPGASMVTVTLSDSASDFQAMLSEWYNVATSSPVDGSSSAVTMTSSNPGTVLANSFTTSNSGDLIYTCGFDVQGPMHTEEAVYSFTAGDGNTLLSANIDLAAVDEYQIQGSAGPVGSFFSVSQDPPGDAWNALSIAFMPASAGTPPPPGIRVVSVAAENANTPTIQFPTTGNLIVVSSAYADSQDFINGISDSNQNTYTQVPQVSGFPQMFYAAGAAAGSTNILSISNGWTQQFVVYDIAGADASPYDTSATATLENDDNSTQSLSIAPSTANGLIISVLNNGIGPNVRPIGSGGLFDNCQYSGETDGGLMNAGDGYQHYYNPDTSPVTVSWTWNTPPDSLPETSSALAVAFKASPGFSSNAIKANGKALRPKR